jgi:8-oxo-dGTP pyrophosphatase MutT (NUDIX family)
VEFDKNEINQRIALEMFEGLIREVVEETGVPATCLCEPLFIGISQRLINVRPTAFFYVKCTISSSQVQEFYQCATDGFESTHLLAIPKVKDTKYVFLWCPSTKPNISLYPWL